MSFRTFGLIGQPLTHSFSQQYFTEKFLKEDLQNVEYKLFPLNSVESLQELLKQYPSLSGFNVTIPYKESVIPLLQELDQISSEVGAVNTVKITQRDDKPFLKGYNTDVIGFRSSIKPFLESHHSKALILGTGGASKAVAYVLKELGIDYHFVSRTALANDHTFSYADLNQYVLDSFPLIINTTPVGMTPKQDEFPAIPYELINEKHFVYDLIYNPEQTIFLKKAKDKGALTLNGMDMLVGQAEAAWKIWNEN